MIKNQVFIAISSNSRELYKADIYRILAKPNNSIEHFRYQMRWIDNQTNNDCVNKDTLLKQTVVLIFKDVSTGKYIPIRKAEIIDYNYNSQTEIHHYYFKLSDFCDFDDEHSINFTENKFFSKLLNAQLKFSSWKTKIEQVKAYFNDKIFYNINGFLNSDGESLKIYYDNINNSYFYKFIQGKSYTLILSIANPNDSKNTLTIKSSSDDINIVISEEYNVTIPYDNVKIPISTKQLDAFKEKSFMSFYLNNESDPIGEYENHLHISKTINLLRPIIFGVFSTIIIVCTWLIKDKTTQIANVFCFDCNFDIASVLYVFLLLFSTSYLLAVYNKK